MLILDLSSGHHLLLLQPETSEWGLGYNLMPARVPLLRLVTVTISTLLGTGFLVSIIPLFVNSKLSVFTSARFALHGNSSRLPVRRIPPSPLTLPIINGFPLSATAALQNFPNIRRSNGFTSFSNSRNLPFDRPGDADEFQLLRPGGIDRMPTFFFAHIFRFHSNR